MVSSRHAAGHSYRESNTLELFILFSILVVSLSLHNHSGFVLQMSHILSTGVNIKQRRDCTLACELKLSTDVKKERTRLLS